ncbi:SWI/SNF complex protein [Mycena amicta]|nr:SWI/SNF complex protein [Mycena amicta]
MYQDLLAMERKLDWTMMRKKAEIQDTLARTPPESLLISCLLQLTRPQTTRTLRIFLSHTLSGQAWQNTPDLNDAPNFDTGEGIPAWALKIEGRLLELPNQRMRDKSTLRKFSTFIKRMVVDLDRDPALYPDGNMVEWPRAVGAQNPQLDGFTIRRTGDLPTKARIIIHLEHNPEQYRLIPELSHVLGIREDSRVGVIQQLWNYIKIQGLQDKADRRLVHADEKLRFLVHGTSEETFSFQKLPELVNRCLMAPDPIVLHYTIDPNLPAPDRPMAWDVEVKMEDTVLKSKATVMLQGNKESTQTLAKLDDEIATHAQSLHNSYLKRTFLQSFARDPAHFIQTWLESQSRDLETVLGSGASEGLTIRQEELRRSEFFHLPWVEEAVAIQEGHRLANKAAPGNG